MRQEWRIWRRVGKKRVPLAEGLLKAQKWCFSIFWHFCNSWKWQETKFYNKFEVATTTTNTNMLSLPMLLTLQLTQPSRRRLGATGFWRKAHTNTLSWKCIWLCCGANVTRHQPSQTDRHPKLSGVDPTLWGASKRVVWWWGSFQQQVKV